MELKITGTPSEIKELLQTIVSSQEQLVVKKDEQLIRNSHLAVRDSIKNVRNKLDKLNLPEGYQDLAWKANPQDLNLLISLIQP